LAADIQHVLGDFQQWQIAAGRGSLEQANSQLAIVPLDLLANTNLAIGLVDVAPPEPEYFTAAQAVEQQELEGRIQRVVLSCSLYRHLCLGPLHH
jgi:hypothetical protein